MVKDARSQDFLDKVFSGYVLCIEIEIAGLINNFPYIIIRGIYNYTNSERGKS